MGKIVEDIVIDATAAGITIADEIAVNVVIVTTQIMVTNQIMETTITGKILGGAAILETIIMVKIIMETITMVPIPIPMLIAILATARIIHAKTTASNVSIITATTTTIILAILVGAVIMEEAITMAGEVQ